MELNEEVVKKSLDWLNNLVGYSYDCDSDMAMFTYQLLGILYNTCEELTEENERLKEQNEAKINANFSLSVLREAKADTVKKMRKIITANYAVSKVHYVENEEPTITYQLTNWQLDQIAKEMLEGEK